MTPPALLFARACTTTQVDQRAEIRDEVDQAIAETIAQLVADHRDSRKSLDESPG